MKNMIGQKVRVIIDRPLGSAHPKYNNLVYPVNYGYVEGIFAADGEEQDAYILGVNEPIKDFTGVVIAVIHRLNDVEDKLVVTAKGQIFTKEEISAATMFQEQYFDVEIIMQKDSGFGNC